MPNNSQGLQIGKVIQLEDPENAGRILVSIAAITKKAATQMWVRVAATYAGDNRGMFFLPEIGDEVLLGFVNDDPRNAVMIGMLWGSSKTAPVTASNANNEKGIFTRSNLQIHFSDDTKTITIKTPAGNSIILDEGKTGITISDQNQNTITLNSKGISLQSATQIEIKATGNLVLSAGGLIDINAAATLNMKAATTKLAAQATNEITGSVVKIN